MNPFAELSPVHIAEAAGDEKYTGLYIHVRQPTTAEYQTFQAKCEEAGIGVSALEQTADTFRQTMTIKNPPIELRLYMLYITYGGAHFDAKEWGKYAREKKGMKPAQIKEMQERIEKWVEDFPKPEDDFETFKRAADEMGLYDFLTIFNAAFAVYYSFIGGELIFRPSQ